VSAAGIATIERVRDYEMRRFGDRDARERDAREQRIRSEMENLEKVVRSMRAAIDEEQGEEDQRKEREGNDGSSQCHAD
jgi:hypothetical protein